MNLEDEELSAAPVGDVVTHQARTGQAALPAAGVVRVRGRVLVERVALFEDVVIRVLERTHRREGDRRALRNRREVERPEAVGDPTLRRRRAACSLPGSGLLPCRGWIGDGRVLAVGLALARRAAGHGVSVGRRRGGMGGVVCDSGCALARVGG